MKFLLPSLLALSLTASTLQVSRAQTPTRDGFIQKTVAAQVAIGAASANLNAALLNGDAQSALNLLAPDFELGQHQYRKRDLDWMKTALPLQLQAAKFTELSTQVDNVSWQDGKAIARGKVVVRATANGSGRVRGFSSGNAGTWIETPDGWRLLSDTGVFGVLSRLEAPVAPIAPQDDNVPHISGLARENPVVVLEQFNNLNGRVSALAFSPDGAILAVGDDTKVRFASTQTGAQTGEMAAPAWIRGLAYAPDGTLFTSHNDGKVRQWDVAKSALLRTFAIGENYNVHELMLAPNGQSFAASNGSAFQIWDVPSATVTRTLPERTAVVGFSPDSSRLALLTNKGVEIQNLDGTPVASYDGQSWAGFGADSQTVLTQTADKLSFHALNNAAVERETAIPNPFRKPLPTIQLNGAPMLVSGFRYTPPVTMAPDGKIAVSVFVDGTIGVWETQTGTLRRLLRGFQRNLMGGGVSVLAFSPDSQLLAVGSHSGETAIWNVSLGKP